MECREFMSVHHKTKTSGFCQSAREARIQIDFQLKKTSATISLL
jgi:hypothetical protein